MHSWMRGEGGGAKKLAWLLAQANTHAPRNTLVSSKSAEISCLDSLCTRAAWECYKTDVSFATASPHLISFLDKLKNLFFFSDKTSAFLVLQDWKTKLL